MSGYAVGGYTGIWEGGAQTRSILQHKTTEKECKVPAVLRAVVPWGVVGESGVAW